MQILEFEELPSTQDEARRVADSSEEWTVVLAKRQTKGKGKPGSSWYSPDGGLYFSVILKPRKNPSDLSPFTLMMAQAICKIIEKECGMIPDIKLPNDVLIAGKKVCGILTEKIKDALIVGVGLNVNTSGFPPDLNATSLKMECKREFKIGDLLAAIINEFKIAYSKFLFNKV